MRRIYVLIFMSLFILAGCSDQDEAQAVAELVENGARHAEAHRIGDLLDLATTDFTATPGHYNRGATRGILYRAFQYYGNFTIHYPRPAIRIEDPADGSLVTMYFVLVKQDANIPGLEDLADDPRKWLDTVGEKADLYQLKLDLVKKDKKWRVRQAHIEGFKGTGF